MPTALQSPSGPLGEVQHPPAKVCRFAVASLVLGIVGAWMFALIFGFKALAKIRRTGQTGHAMAVTGIVLGLLWATACAVFTAVSFAT